VITTKFRKKIFNEGIFAYFDIKLAEITHHYPLITFTKVNHDKDHIHLLMSIPPTMSVGKAVGLIKQNTARELKQKFQFLRQVYWGTEAVWSEGYFVSTVGTNESIIKHYIENQGKEETGQATLELN
jgi:putative transposase